MKKYQLVLKIGSYITLNSKIFFEDELKKFKLIINHYNILLGSVGFKIIIEEI